MLPPITATPWLAGHREQSVEQPIDCFDIERLRQHEREQRGARTRTHRGQIAQVHGKCTVPDRVQRHEGAIEMNAFDDGVSGQDVKRTPLGLDNRGVVAGAHEHPGRCGERRCETRRNASNQRPLTEGGEGKMCQKAPLCRVGRSYEPA